jgi:hypothetical protein
MWSGASSAIPTGWNLCDGNNGTPNLTGKFIKAATTAGGTGGSASSGSHTMTTAEGPSHTHDAGPASGVNWGGVTALQVTGNGSAGGWSTSDVSGGTSGGGAHSHTIEPVYYALLYIMKS